jgi:hypothetical protein
VSYKRTKHPAVSLSVPEGHKPTPPRDDYHAECRRIQSLGYERCASHKDESTLLSMGFLTYGDEKWRACWGTAMPNWFPGPVVYVVQYRNMSTWRRFRRLEALAADPDLVAALHAVWMSIGSWTHGVTDGFYNERTSAVEAYLTDLGLGPPKRTIP